MSSKRNVRRRTCDRKVRYETQEEASAARTRLFRSGSGGMNVYKCKFCGGYHIGHRNERQQKAFQAAKGNK